MILKCARIFALFVAVLVCQSAQAPLTCGVLQPMVSSPQYDPDLSQGRRDLTVDERLHGSRDVPAGGIGLTETWGW
jgi:hypothetical protein